MSDSTVKRIASTWAQRAQAEIGAEKRFKNLIERFVDHRVHDNIVSMALNAVEEERRHSQMCKEVAKHFGHSTGHEKPQTVQTFQDKSWLSKESEKNILTIEIVLMCCLTETINASLLNTLYASTKKSYTGRTLHQILKDEVKHGQMGWAYLALESKKQDNSFIGQYLPEILEMTVNDELFLPLLGGPEDPQSLCQNGVLPFELRKEQFTETFQTVVVPGLQQFGIETQLAERWLGGKLKPTNSVITS